MSDLIETEESEGTIKFSLIAVVKSERTDGESRSYWSTDCSPPNTPILALRLHVTHQINPTADHTRATCLVSLQCSLR